MDKKFNFGDFVDAHSISRPAAVDITVVTVERPPRYEGETFLDRQHGDYVEIIQIMSEVPEASHPFA